MPKQDEPTISLPKLLTVKQVAEFTQFSKKQILRWIEQKKLHARKIGRHWRIAENDLALFLATFTT